MTPHSGSLRPLPTIGSHLIVAPTQPHPTPVPIRHTLESPSPPRAIDGCRAVTRPARGKRVVVREDGPRAHGVTIKRRDWAPKRIRLAAIDARLLPDCEAAQHTTAFEAEQIADAELESMQCEGSGAAERPSPDEARSLQLVVRYPPVKGPGRSRTTWRPAGLTATDADTDDSSDDAPRRGLALEHEAPSPLPPSPKRRACGDAADEIDLFASDSEDGDSPSGVVPSLTLPPPPSPSLTDDEEEIDVPPDNRFAGYYQYKSPLRPRADGMKWWEKPT